MDYRFLIARRYLASPKRVSLISTITGISMAGVGLGVAALLVVLSVMNGFFDFVRDMLVSFDPHVRIVSTSERGFAHADSLRDVALSLPHVEHAAPYVEGKALLVHEGLAEVNKVVIVRGVEAATLSGVSRVVERTRLGTFDLGRHDGRPGIVVGQRLAQRLGLAVAEAGRPAGEVGLLSAPAIERLFTRVFSGPQLPRFEVRGLYELEAVYDENHVFIALDEARRLFRMGDRVSGLELRLDDLDRAGAVKAQLEARLDPERFTVLTWYDLQRSLYDVMLLEKWGASLIMALIVIVAAFSIVGSLTMVVIEKRRDVGALQAMGVSRRNIRRIFLLEGLFIGVIGTGAGLALALVLLVLQQQFGLVRLPGAGSFLIEAYPVAIRALDVVLIGLVSVALCVVASLYPARRAAAIEPARAVQLDG
ncbi:ABC transporter permease [Rhodocaloribacter litoris]|uniref:ABC transporter permease n=1 Tax=Rhodocaloribacter litoris TaxID=2558931 RepID=UPI00142338C3|nr:ABC transporter permease [Rhodocaloribacter litoris]QXD13751.1 ABC transporter permease [Rhodocaloribacter litoris]